MGHLSPDQLLDIAEGTFPADSAPHLASCASCQEQLSALRGILADAVKVPVPEPSPLFWDHFSARVSDAVAAEASPERHWLGGWSWRPVSMASAALVLMAVVAVVAVVEMGSMRGVLRPATVSPAESEPSVVASATSEPEAPLGAVDEAASFNLVADLAGEMDLDSAQEAGLVSDDAAEHAVAHLSTGELQELARLLKEEIGRVQPS